MWLVKLESGYEILLGQRPEVNKGKMLPVRLDGVQWFCAQVWDKLCPQMKLRMGEVREILPTKRGLTLARKRG